MIKLAVFLGNPGKEYAATRHNFGRMLLDTFESTREIAWRSKFHGKVGEWSTGAGKCRLLVPETFMNLAGKSLAAAMTFHKTKPEEILVVHDDLELPFGTYAWRKGGGLAGHNGLKSLRDSIGTAGFNRLRLGIGRPERGSVQSWVLGRFDPVQEAILPQILDPAAGTMEEILTGSISVHDRGETVRVYP